MKQCITCKLDKQIEYFSFRTDTGKYRNVCKDCIKNNKAQYYLENIDDAKQRNKKWREENKQYKKEKAKQYHQDHKEEENEKGRQRRKENRKQLNEYQKIYQKQQRIINPYFKVRQNTSNLFNQMLTSNGCSKNGSSFLSIVDWNMEEFWIHFDVLFSHPDNLTPDGKIWMTRYNQGKYNANTWDDNDPTTWVWNTDHIIPQSFFKFSKDNSEEFIREQMRKCWALSNLRPLSAKQNMIDGNRR